MPGGLGTIVNTSSRLVISSWRSAILRLSTPIPHIRHRLPSHSIVKQYGQLRRQRTFPTGTVNRTSPRLLVSVAVLSKSPPFSTSTPRLPVSDNRWRRQNTIAANRRSFLGANPEPDESGSNGIAFGLFLRRSPSREPVVVVARIRSPITRSDPKQIAHLARTTNRRPPLGPSVGVVTIWGSATDCGSSLTRVSSTAASARSSYSPKRLPRHMRDPPPNGM